MSGDSAIKIIVDDLSGDEITNLLNEHVSDMQSISPAESNHALDLDGLRQADITFWSAWDNQSLAGCCAIKELDTNHAEIKSMRTSSSHARKGIASKLLQHLIEVAELRGYRRLSLETGSKPYFQAARNLYEKFGFEYCAPFAGYKEDPNSVFMSKEL